MLYFCNAGEVNIRALMTFGVSAKSNDSAIGFFGTGAKYAISIVLREKGTLTINGEHHFSTRALEHRGKEFDEVLLNGEPTGFTTHLGANWEPWQAYRELYCNAVDEGGIVTTREPDQSYDTVITVDCPALEQAHTDREQYINTRKPIESPGQIDIMPDQSGRVFYKNIAVHELSEPSVVTYNVRCQVDLTEDRTAKYPSIDINWPIKTGISCMTNERTLRRILSAPKGTLEHGLDYSDCQPSEEFLDVARRLLKTGHLVEGARLLLEKVEDGQWPVAKLNKMQGVMFNRALDLLKSIDVRPRDYKINFVETLGDGVLGRAYAGEIYISQLAFNMGTKQLASTLLEEYVHVRAGVADFDRGMQNWLFDKICTLAEEMRGEPV